MKIIEINESNIKISKNGNVKIFQWKGHIEESVILTNEELNKIVKIANKKTDQKSYKIIRFFQDHNKPNKVILTGLTLEQAQNHCQDPDTSGDGWFDGYDEHNLLGYSCSECDKTFAEDEPSWCDDGRQICDDCYCTKKRVTL